MTWQASPNGAVPTGDQVDPLYEEACDYTLSKTDTRDIKNGTQCCVWIAHNQLTETLSITLLNV